MNFKLHPRTKMYFQQRLIKGTGIAIQQTPLLVMTGLVGLAYKICDPGSDTIAVEINSMILTILNNPLWEIKKEAIIMDVLDVIQSIPDSVLSNLYCPPETQEDLCKSLADLAPPPFSGVGGATTSDIIVKK